MCRVRSPQVVHPYDLLHLVRHPLQGRPCPFGRPSRAQLAPQPSPAASSSFQGRQAYQRRRRCCAGRQGCGQGCFRISLSKKKKAVFATRVLSATLFGDSRRGFGLPTWCSSFMTPFMTLIWASSGRDEFMRVSLKSLIRPSKPQPPMFTS